MLTLGIGGGALLAGIVSRGKVELGLVPLGGLGIALTSMLLATVPGGAAGHPADAGYYTSCVLAAGDGRHRRAVRHSLAGVSPRPQPAGIARLDHGGLQLPRVCRHVGGLGRLLAAVRPVGAFRPAIFLVGGIVTVPVTIFIVRLLPFQTTRLAVRLLTNCMYRVRVEGLENVPEHGGALVVANHVSWADGVLLGLACPRHPRMVAYAKYFESPWLGWFGRLGRIIPIGTTRKSMVESIRAAREALQQGEIGVYLSRRRHQPRRANRRSSGRASCRS